MPLFVLVGEEILNTNAGYYRVVHIVHVTLRANMELEVLRIVSCIYMLWILGTFATHLNPRISGRIHLVDQCRVRET